MINFNIKKAKIYSAIKWERVLFLKFFRNTSFILLILLLLIFFNGFVLENLSEDVNKLILGVILILFAILVSTSLKLDFFENKVKKPKAIASLSEALANLETYNLAEFLSFAVAKIANKAQNREASSGHLFYYAIQDSKELDFILPRLLLNKDSLIKEVREHLSTDEDSFNQVIIKSLEIALKNGHDRVMMGDLLSALARIDKMFKEILLMKDLRAEDIDSLVLWLDSLRKKESKRPWDYESLARHGTLAKEWTSGYTLTLDQYGNDISHDIRKKDLDFIGHEKDIERVERVLSRGAVNNVLIIGEEGTGKKSMIYALAQKSLLGKSTKSVNYKRFVELDMSRLLADLTSTDAVESVLDKIFHEATVAGNVILIIDGIDNYLSSDVGPGVINISGIVSSYLRIPEFRLIGISNYEGLHRHIEKNPAILTLFSKVEISGILPEKTIILLEYLTFSLEQKHKIFIPYQSIRKIIDLTDKYFPSLHFPEKAMNILDEVAVYVANLKGESIVLPEHVNKIISEKSEIPVGEIESKERAILLNLEDLIHQRIINQNKAVKEVSTALRRARSEITVRKGPMGAFLFLGPTGVGKTETAKALAHFYFGSVKKMIRLDMSEFQSVSDIGRLIGSESEPGLLTTPVKENPFSLILLDELEKADHNILNLFLQVIDDGHLTDGMGRKVSFKNTIIIATSNAGYKIILQAIKENQGWGNVKQKILDYIFEKRIFRPEFINRFDATVIFEPLSQKHLVDIASLMLSSLRKNILEKGIELTITQELKEKIAQLGYNPVFGARHMRRVIQEKVENILASALLSNKIKRGDKVSINPKTFELEISN